MHLEEGLQRLGGFRPIGQAKIVFTHHKGQLLKQLPLGIARQQRYRPLVGFRPLLFVMMNLSDAKLRRQALAVVFLRIQKIRVHLHRFIKAVEQEQIFAMQKSYITNQLALWSLTDKSFGSLKAWVVLLELVLTNCQLALHLIDLRIITPALLHSLQIFDCFHPIGIGLQH